MRNGGPARQQRKIMAEALPQIGFGRESISLSLDRSTTDEVIEIDEVTEFVRQVDAVLGMVLDELEITYSE